MGWDLQNPIPFNKIIYMKILLRLIFSFVCCSVYGQTAQIKNTAQAQVEYQFFGNLFMPTSYYATLYVNRNVSLFYEKPNDNAVREELKADNGEAYQSLTTSKKTNFIEPYLKIDRSKREILFFEEIGANLFLVQDTYQDLNWIITKETKTQQGFLCTKATLNFRGRDWVAWFATDIPLHFGPWKFHGLPGLIMEIYDVANKYKWKVVKIEFKESDLFKKDFGLLMKAKNKKPISFQQFLTDNKEYDYNVNAEMMKNDPDLRDIPVPNDGRETKFEWDK